MVDFSNKHSRTKRFIKLWCPNMRADDVDWVAASEPSWRYNCFGFVMGETRWWQPPIDIDGVVQFPDHYWPKGIPTDDSIESYLRAAETEGFRVSPDFAWEEGLETIMLYYTERNREFQHAARQKSPGVWESKIGSWSDIEHPIDGVDTITYGTGRIYMQRRSPQTQQRVG
jgi:hypothetical protein